MRFSAIAALVGLLVAGCLSAWMMSSAHHGTLPPGRYAVPQDDTLLLSGNEAESERRSLLARAAFVTDDAAAADLVAGSATPEILACQFLAAPPSGTSAKFDCVTDGGERLKVKYGRNAELHAEAAATRLVRALGYAADRIDIVPRLRCYGCPRYPFATMKLLALASLPQWLAPHGHANGYTDFDWVAVERRFPAPPIETTATEGWSWWELERSQASRAETDAFRLLAVFLAHWDNKASNQRLVCMDDRRPAGASGCERPLAMIHDLGATFGPPKANLAQWRETPVWEDPRTCTVSMALLPWGGATFGRSPISEAGRRRFLDRLGRVTDADLRRIFTEARFPEYQIGTAEQRDLTAWIAAFRFRELQVVKAQCPQLNAQGPRPNAQ